MNKKGITFRRKFMFTKDEPEWWKTGWLKSENDSGQVGYIDTGIKPDFDTNIECEWYLDRNYINYLSNVPIFGASSNLSYIMRQGNNYYISTINDNINSSNVEKMYPNNTVCNYKRDNNVATINNIDTFTHNRIATISNSTLCLMNIREISWLNSVKGIRIGNFKITKGDIVLRDFIPMTNGTDTAMYDKVSKQMFLKILV